MPLALPQQRLVGIAAHRALEGAVLGCGAPLGWLAIVFLSGGDPLDDLRQQPGLYLYMLLGTLLAFALYGYYVGKREQESESRSLRDGLTGLFNARYFWQRLRSDMEAARRLHFPLSLVMLDLDHFKRVNDEHGHAAGDIVLKELAGLLLEASRTSDTPARVGGEEFALILPFTDARAAANLADRIRLDLAARSIDIGTREPIRITASFGVAEQAPGGNDTPRELFARADAAMYRAKAGGRNRVE